MPRRTFAPGSGVLLAHGRLAGQQLLQQPTAALDVHAQSGGAELVLDRRRPRGRPRSGTSTGTSRVTRNAVSAGPRPRAVAITSITLSPGSSGTRAENVPPPLTVAGCPSTRTPAPAGVTVPRTSTVAVRTVAMSSGAVTSSSTGRGGA